MTIEPIAGNKFLVCRHSRYTTTYFAFYVDHNSSSWTRYQFAAHKFATREKAAKAVENLKQRNRIQREERAARKANET